MELEQLCVYARHLLPLLRTEILSDPVDLTGVVLTHYRAKEQGKAKLVLEDGEVEYLAPVSDIGQGKARDDEDVWLSEIIAKLNDLFAGEALTDKDMVNYMQTIADKVRENDTVMDQLKNNTREQALLGDFSKAMLDAVLESRGAHEKQAVKVLSNEAVAKSFGDLLLDVLLRGLQKQSGVK